MIISTGDKCEECFRKISEISQIAQKRTQFLQHPKAQVIYEKSCDSVPFWWHEGRIPFQNARCSLRKPFQYLVKVNELQEWDSVLFLQRRQDREIGRSLRCSKASHTCMMRVLLQTNLGSQWSPRFGKKTVTRTVIIHCVFARFYIAWCAPENNTSYRINNRARARWKIPNS